MMPKNIRGVLKDLTVEPAFFLFVTVNIILEITNKNLWLQKQCRVNITSEPDLDTRCIDEKPGILLVSEINATYRLVTVLFCSVCAIFAVCWSDEAGRRRRPLIVIPIIGIIFQCLSCCLHTYFWPWDPINAAITFFGIEMLSGGHSLLLLVTQMYICDVSSLESRTMRLGILSAARIFGNLFGIGSSGFILRFVGFFYTYLICAVMSVVSLILAIWLVKDCSVPVDKPPTLGHVFNLKRIKNSFDVVYRKSLGSKRILVSTLIIIYTAVVFSVQGEKTMLYIFLRHRFQWDERQFSSYSIYRYISAIIGSIFCSVILSKRFKVHDGIIGMFSGTFDTLAALGYLFASQDWHFYGAALFDVFHSTAAAVSYSFMSKYYEKDEIGRLNSVLSIFSLIIPIGQPAYNIIFQHTLDVFPSAYFVLSVLIDVAVVMLYAVSYILSRKIDAQKPIVKEEKSMIDSRY